MTFIPVRVLWEQANLSGEITAVAYGWTEPLRGPVTHVVISDTPLWFDEIDDMRRLIENRLNRDPFPS